MLKINFLVLWDLSSTFLGVVDYVDLCSLPPGKHSAVGCQGHKASELECAQGKPEVLRRKDAVSARGGVGQAGERTAAGHPLTV